MIDGEMEVGLCGMKIIPALARKKQAGGERLVAGRLIRWEL